MADRGANYATIQETLPNLKNLTITHTEELERYYQELLNAGAEIIDFIKTCLIDYTYKCSRTELTGKDGEPINKISIEIINGTQTQVDEADGEQLSV